MLGRKKKNCGCGDAQAFLVESAQYQNRQLKGMRQDVLLLLSLVLATYIVLLIVDDRLAKTFPKLVKELGGTNV